MATASEFFSEDSCVFPSGSQIDLLQQHLAEITLVPINPSETSSSVSVSPCPQSVQRFSSSIPSMTPQVITTDFHTSEVSVKDSDATRIQLANAKGPHGVAATDWHRCDAISFLSSSHWAAAPLLLDVAIQTLDIVINQIRRKLPSLSSSIVQPVFATKQQFAILTFGMNANSKKKAIRAATDLQSFIAATISAFNAPDGIAQSEPQSSYHYESYDSSLQAYPFQSMTLHQSKFFRSIQEYHQQLLQIQRKLNRHIKANSKRAPLLHESVISSPSRTVVTELSSSTLQSTSQYQIHSQSHEDANRQVKNCIRMNSTVESRHNANAVIQQPQQPLPPSYDNNDDETLSQHVSEELQYDDLPFDEDDIELDEHHLDIHNDHDFSDDDLDHHDD
jgi:hypothetical protein